MFAVVEIAGFQNTVTPGMKLRVPKLSLKVGEAVTFDRVLLREGDKGVEVGAPYVLGAKVEAKVLSLGRGEKIRVYKMHARKRYRKLQGHRQDYTEIEVTGIKG